MAAWRDNRSTPGLQKQDNDQHHQNQRFKQGMDYSLDRTTDG